LQHLILDLLMDGPSSFLALYGALATNCGYVGRPSHLMQSLAGAEEKRWLEILKATGSGTLQRPSRTDRERAVRSYEALLASAEVDFSCDEVGLWFALTDAGRNECRRWFAEDGETREPAGRWSLDEDAEGETIVVHAETLELADEVVRRWLALNPGAALLPSPEIGERVEGFWLKSGEFSRGGFRVVRRFRRI
jgi:hypothetical protein